MIKAMVFIDGSWLYHNLRVLAEVSGSDGYQADYGRLPSLLGKLVAAELGPCELDIVRVYLFGSYPENCDPNDVAGEERALGFFSMLREEYRFEVELFPMDYQGRRLRGCDRDPEDDFQPKEKCVDVALATRIVSLAAKPNAYDVAIAVLGDRDFKPALQEVRSWGKRIAIASIRGACASEYSDPSNRAGVRDLPIIWLDDHPDELRRSDETRKTSSERETESQWDRLREHLRKKPASDAQMQSERTSDSRAPEMILGETVQGTVKKKFPDDGYAFIRGPFGDYYFRRTDVWGHAPFEELVVWTKVEFEVVALPRLGRNGRAKNVHPSCSRQPAGGSQGDFASLQTEGTAVAA